MANSCAMRPSLGRILRLSESPISASVPLTSILPPRTASFSTSSSQCKRKTRDSNRLRGVSELRRTGPREPLSVSWSQLPKPAKYKPEIYVDPNHGLWGFFPSKDKLMNTPAEDSAHGRSWAVEELRKKDWEDLHALWWACCKERNRISTAKAERNRAELGFGSFEGNNRDETVIKTMKGIKHVLTERYYLWQDAYQLAEEDPEIDLSGTGEAYTPIDQYEEELSDEDYLLQDESKHAEEVAGEHKAGESQGIIDVDQSILPPNKPTEQSPKI